MSMSSGEEKKKRNGSIRSTNYVLSPLWGALHKLSPSILTTIRDVTIPQNPGGGDHASGQLVRRCKSYSSSVLAALQLFAGGRSPLGQHLHWTGFQQASVQPAVFKPFNFTYALNPTTHSSFSLGVVLWNVR